MKPILATIALLLAMGCASHKPLTAGQNLLMTAPTSSKPVLNKRGVQEFDTPIYDHTPAINMMAGEQEEWDGISDDGKKITIYRKRP